MAGLNMSLYAGIFFFKLLAFKEGCIINPKLEQYIQLPFYFQKKVIHFWDLRTVTVTVCPMFRGWLLCRNINPGLTTMLNEDQVKYCIPLGKGVWHLKGALNK